MKILLKLLAKLHIISGSSYRQLLLYSYRISELQEDIMFPTTWKNEE